LAGKTQAKWAFQATAAMLLLRRNIGGGNMRIGLALAIIMMPCAVQAQSPASAPALRPDQEAFRALYRELVEIDTSITTGDCTLLATRVAARFKAAGFANDQIIPYSTPDHPREGGLVVIYPGASKNVKPLLLIGHIDVVAAKPEDWTRNPYIMVEEGGYFYGRGTADMKSIDAIWIDALLRFKASGYKPKRTVKLALTCGEETNGAFNGAEWLAANRRALIDAEFALNEGGGGSSDGHGKVVEQAIQVGEKTFATYRLETRNPGGHSAAPRPDNAIYELAHALMKLEAHEFPAEMTDTTRAYFRAAGQGRGDATGAAMTALAANPGDTNALALVDQDTFLHANLRTTCVATMLDGGHARNALAQRAGAYVNCRIFPGHSVESIRDEIASIVADPGVVVTTLAPKRPAPPAPPLDPKVIDPARRLVAKYFPGVPLVPVMANGYTDATFLGAAGIPTYGVPGPWGDPDGNGAHGLNERLEARSLFVGRDFLFDLIKAYAG
jgi:acetylornithine deacetylase/succinyl-diaminopimelate desuccinylase-like protein